MRNLAIKLNVGVTGSVLKGLVAVLCLLPAWVQARTWPASVGEGTISRWSGDRISAFTVTIDDNHAQDHAFWKDLGEEYGRHWTWCVITENVGSDGSTWAGWQELVDLGHGIASHGLHAYDENTAGVNVTNEYRDSQQALRDNLTGVDALTLAYPNGYKPPNDSDLAVQYFIAARGVNGGVNTGNSINYTNTLSISMNGTTAPGITDPGTWYYYGHTINPSHQFYEGWQSVHFHSVLSSMVEGVTNLAATLSSNDADIWTGRFQDVAQYGQERENATLNVTSVSGTEIHFTVGDTLDDALFYFPLTVKIRVDSAWSNVSAFQDGDSVAVELVEYAGNKYALVQAVPDQGDVVLHEGARDGLLVVVRGLSHNRIWVDGDFAGTPVGSYAAPYKTVQNGLNAAAAGDIVTVREGAYREEVIFPTSGTVEQPITLASAPGERVVLNATEPVLGWQVVSNGMYAAPLDGRPNVLFSGYKELEQAREPNEGWWEAERASTNASGNFLLTDVANLTGFSLSLDGAAAWVWNQTYDRFYICPTVSIDAGTGVVEISNPFDMPYSPATKYKYWLFNQPSLIDQPNEWAYNEPDVNGTYWAYYYPETPADLDHTQATLESSALPRSGRAITVQDVSHVRFDGVEFFGADWQGVYLQNVQDVQLNHCVIHGNREYGVLVKNSADVVLRNSILKNNRMGVVVQGTSGLHIENNEIGPNREDGLVLSSSSSNLWVQGNYIHDHLMWGHPDNSQMYLGVEDVHFIDNLMITAVQSVMMEEAVDGEFLGNMFLGSGANMLIFGHDNASDFVLRGNTLALSGYNNLYMTAENYEVKDNVFMTGHERPVYTVKDTMNYDGDHNLFWNSVELVDPVVLVSDGAWGSAPGPAELFRVVYDCHSLAAGATSVGGTSSHTDVTIGNLTLPGTFPPSNWPNALTALQNNAAINSLASAISAGDYFSFTVAPGVLSTASYTNLHVRVSLGANNQPAETVFTLMSSLAGFTSADALVAFTNETLAASTMGIVNNLDLGGVSSLQNVAAGTSIEFRLYAHNIGANSMTRIGVGAAWGAAADDLRLSGSVSVDSGSGGPSETIYHTDLASFQSTTGLDMNSAQGNPLFVNAPAGINVMDTALLHEATRATFSLRDTNRFVVGDHVELNFDGVVRTVTASSGAVLTIDPALDTKPLKGGLVANWGANSDFLLDLTLQPASPGAGLAEDGGNAGSTISIQHYKAGDFDGDGRRDLPGFEE